MSYLVLARKFRPQRFDELVGQEHVTRTLINALESGRLAHAYVFSGPRGCGKTTTARILAKALNCVKGPTPTPCGECPQCKEIAAGSSTDDVLEIDGASNRGIDQIRELREIVKYAPARSRNRVIIIDEAHQISKDGFNALLKTLEEPPPHVVFMMATTEAQKIPETILSRCQRFQLRAITPAEIADQLRKILTADNLKAEDGALIEVARAAHGSLRDALSLMDQVIAFAPQGATTADVRRLLGLLPREFVREFAHTLREGDRSRVLLSIDKALADGLDLTQLAEALLDHTHERLLWKAGVRDPRHPDAAALETDTADETLARLERDLGVLSRTSVDLRRSESPRVTFELSCLELAQGLLPVEELVTRLEELEERLGGGTVAPAAATPVPLARPAPAVNNPFSAPPVVGFSRPVVPPPISTGAVKVSPPPVSTPPSAAGSGLDVRRAWERVLGDIDGRKPSLATFLRTAHPSFPADGGLELVCSQDFQKSQILAQQAVWADLLKIYMGRAVPVRVTASAAPPALAPAPRPAAPPPRPTPVVEDAEEVTDENENASEFDAAPANTGDEDPEAVAPVDAGLKKVLNKFPGKLRKVEE